MWIKNDKTPNQVACVQTSPFPSLTSHWNHGGLMSSALDSGLSGQGSTTDWCDNLPVEICESIVSCPRTPAGRGGGGGGGGGGLLRYISGGEVQLSPIF